MTSSTRHLLSLTPFLLLAGSAASLLSSCSESGSEEKGGNADAGAEAAAGGQVGTGGSGAGGASQTGGAAQTGGASGDGGGATPCTSDDECFGATSHCDTANGVCVGCKSTADCLGSLKCDTATGICRDCVTNSDCPQNAPICDPVSQQCSAECTTNADCSGTGGPSTCDTTRGRCVDCIGNGMPCQFCELGTYSCVGCLVDADCPQSAPKCGPSYECTPACTTDNDCPAGLFCDTATQACVECVTNAHCGGETCQTNYTCG